MTVYPHPPLTAAIRTCLVGTDVGEGFVRFVGRLSALTVSRLREPGMYADGGGLYVQITNTNARSWIFRFTLNGRARSMGLGSLNTITLAEARARSTECRKLCLDGIDPISNRDQVRAGHRLEAARAITFDSCAAAYIDVHRAGWGNQRHVEQWKTTLAVYASPVFGDVPVQAVDVGLVMQALEPIWISKTETASRVRGRIEAILDWAATRGYREGENPARWRGHLQILLPRRARVRRVAHHAALPYQAVPSFMASLQAQAGTAAQALQFTILTAARTGEAAGARWSEIDAASKTWTVPPERMKGGREHRVPLSDATTAILDRMRPLGSDYVFPGLKRSQPLSKTAMLKVVTRMGRTDLTVHGFRSSFRDWASEATQFPAEAVEIALAHAIESKVEAAYRRGDLYEKRRDLMNAWADYSRLCKVH